MTKLSIFRDSVYQVVVPPEELPLAFAAMNDEETLSKTETETNAREQVRAIAGELEAIRKRLLDVHASLPVPPEEAVMLLGELDMDFSTEVRTVIECVVHDFINATIRDLRAAADYVAGEGAGR